MWLSSASFAGCWNLSGPSEWQSKQDEKRKTAYNVSSSERGREDSYGFQMTRKSFRSYVFGPSGYWTMAPRYATLQNFIPSFPWIAPPPTPSTLAQSKERKGSNFTIWQPCITNGYQMVGLQLAYNIAAY